jgi:hypothetical protein
VKQDAEDRIDELKDEEDADDIRTAKDIENMRR